MKKTLIPIVALAMLAAFTSCDEDDLPPDGGTGTDGGNNTGDGGTQIPPPPTLGTQIDRVGRPAVNTALNNTFTADATAAGNAKDAYNSASNPANWSTFQQEIAKNLGIYDGLDSNCGNQLLAAPDAGSARYATLATVLTDDRLYLNTASTTCTQYLAVEANFVGLANNDCGGRKSELDVIDSTYSVLAVGAFSGVTDGVPDDPDGNGSTTFPFLAAP